MYNQKKWKFFSFLICRHFSQILSLKIWKDTIVFFFSGGGGGGGGGGWFGFISSMLEMIFNEKTKIEN